MSWKKYFTTVNKGSDGTYSPVASGKRNNYDDLAFRNYQSHLPELYRGHPNRIERYDQYEQMEQDGAINSALDILSEFATQSNIENGTAFAVHFKEDPTDSEVKIINDHLKTWYSLNEFDRRIFKLFRNVLKYGDQIFLRDPETFKMFPTAMKNIGKVIVNEAEGKEPEYYVITDMNINFQNMSVNIPAHSDEYTVAPSAGGNLHGAYTQPPGAINASGSRFEQLQNETAIEAEHVVHCSLSDGAGMDPQWPFGTSILEQVFKVYKQKELLEDAILIYRIQRAPERRVFHVDVGNMPPHMAMAFIERIKNEIHQRRIPTQTGGGQNMMDATYNPLSTNEDYFFPRGVDGRGSDVTTLPGGQNLDQIDDLRYFTNMLFRALRIPSSYYPSGPEESPAGYNDGRLGVALIQENRFNEYVKRLQKLVMNKLDEEFKYYMRWRGITIDNSMFELRFNEPQNFAKSRQAELDNVQLGTFSTAMSFPFISKRFGMTRYLGMTEEEMVENDKLWREEQGFTNENVILGSDLRSVGVTPGSMAGDIEDLDFADEDLSDMDVEEESMDTLEGPEDDEPDVQV